MGSYPHNNNDEYGNNEPRGRGSYPDDDRGRGRNDDRGGGNRGAGDERQRELLPEATYPVVAVAHRFGYTSNKNEQVGIRLRIVDGPHKDKNLLYYGTFTADAKEFTIKALRALGMYGDDVVKDIGQIYNGQVANAVYAHEVYQGQKRGKVNWINGADVVMKDEMSPSELSAFSNRLRADLKRFPGAQPANAQASSSSARRDQPTPSGQREERGRGDARDDRQQSFSRDDRRNDAPPPDDRDAPWGGNQRGR